jgi:hypothetical protein
MMDSAGKLFEKVLSYCEHSVHISSQPGCGAGSRTRTPGGL